jgi:hypothetical protein
MLTADYYENGEPIWFSFTIYPGEELPFATIWFESDQNWQAEPEIFDDEMNPIFPWTVILPDPNGEQLWLRIPPLPQVPPAPIPPIRPPNPLPIPTPLLPYPYNQQGSLNLRRYPTQPVTPTGVYPGEPNWDNFYPEPGDENQQNVLLPTDSEPDPWVIRPVFRFETSESQTGTVDSGTGDSTVNVEFSNIHGVTGYYRITVEKQGTWPAGSDVTVPAGCLGPISDEIVRNFDVEFTSAPVATETLSCIVTIHTHEVAACADDAITTDSKVITFEAAVIAVDLTPDPIVMSVVPLDNNPVSEDWVLQNNALVPVDFTMVNTPDGGLSGAFVVTPPNGTGLIAGGNQPGTLEYTPAGDGAGDYNGGTLEAQAENPANPSETGSSLVEVHIKVQTPLAGPIDAKYTWSYPGGGGVNITPMTYVGYGGNAYQYSKTWGDGSTTGVKIYDNGTPHEVGHVHPGVKWNLTIHNMTVTLDPSTGHPIFDITFSPYAGVHAVRNPLRLQVAPGIS